MSKQRNYSLSHAGIIHIKNSKSKSNKHIKRGKKGKDCIYFNDKKLTCKNRNSGYYNKFCRSDECNNYLSVIKQTLSQYDDSYIQLPIQSGTHEKTNEYIAVSKNIGTPCHVGYLKNNGVRRHKAKCIYYDKIKKFCKLCLYKCVGSSHCENYKEHD